MKDLVYSLDEQLLVDFRWFNMLCMAFVYILLLDQNTRE